MTWLAEMSADPIWLAAGIVLLAHGAVLILLRIGFRRDLDRRLRQLEKEFGRAQEEEGSNLEGRLREFEARHRESLDALRADIMENRLRSRPQGLGQPGSGPGTRLEKKHRVVSLAQMGYDSREIARKLRLSRGETELLLGLSGRHVSSENGYDGDSL